MNFLHPNNLPFLHPNSRGFGLQRLHCLETPDTTPYPHGPVNGTPQRPVPAPVPYGVPIYGGVGKDQRDGSPPKRNTNFPWHILGDRLIPKQLL